MTIPMRGPEPAPMRRSAGSTRMLWSGGVATAVVAGLIALVGILVCRWLFKIPFLSPSREAPGATHRRRDTCSPPPRSRLPRPG